MKMRHPRGNLPGQQVSAPHPRGCSGHWARKALHARVGPAPAGMLRRVARSASSASCRPRTRGDAPCQRCSSAHTYASAPHPRGCSRRVPGRRLGRHVGPAPAGMLRTACSARAPATSRPRTRGDAPAGRDAGTAHAKSAPHPRGCSLVDAPHVGQGGVGPAPAGMLPPAYRQRPGPSSRPRTRGDAPNPAREIISAYASAPHPRGCSGRGGGAARVVGVGPAPAGMLRGKGGILPEPLSRPRTRGDAPGRGRVGRRPTGAGSVGPAPAGMLRSRAPPVLAAAGRPRTRGDAPAVTSAVGLGRMSAPHPRGCSAPAFSAISPADVGPAPAGMLPVLGGWGPCHRGRPRTRGDAPTSYACHSGDHMSAPHPRGCSLTRSRRRVAPPVGPAPAGMLPGIPRSGSVIARRPRTRGDAPGRVSHDHEERPSAPHPRGCSADRASRQRRPVVGPARGCSVDAALDYGEEHVGPAPAGMLRCRRPRPTPRTGRPRTRGDAPLLDGGGG